MFGWLRGRTLRRGDAVRVMGGPYAGRDGVVADVGTDVLIGVYIDECCQPRLPASALRRSRSRRNIGRAVRSAKESDAEGELARSMMDGRDLGDGF
ncbi:MAG TPA: KOW motif-containing protein [Candidatus Limnocylindria bacterium]